MNIDEKLITFGTAKILNKKDFKFETEKVWINKKTMGGPLLAAHPSLCYTGYAADCITYPAPTQAQLQKWLRKKHDLFVYVKINDNGDGLWWYGYGIWSITQEDFIMNDGYYMKYKNPETALEKGLSRALRLI